jgi:hypothetical protein
VTPVHAALLGAAQAIDDAIRLRCDCRGGPHGGYTCEGCR